MAVSEAAGPIAALNAWAVRNGATVHGANRGAFSVLSRAGRALRGEDYRRGGGALVTKAEKAEFVLAAQAQETQLAVALDGDVREILEAIAGERK